MWLGGAAIAAIHIFVRMLGMNGGVGDPGLAPFSGISLAS